MKKWIIACALGLTQLLGAVPALAHGDNELLITQVLKAQFEKPEAPLRVEPINVEGDFAVAGWSQGGRGGRALLQKDKSQWFIAICGGSGLTQADVLQGIGMGSAAATKLARAVVVSENKLGADQRKLFDGFQGMTKMDLVEGHTSHGVHAHHDQPAALVKK
jgi:hypothetical protein